MLLIGGVIINYLGKINTSSSLLYMSSLLYGFISNILVSFFVFKMILGKKIGKSNLILIPSSLKNKDFNAATFKISLMRYLLTWWGYFWRFALFTFAVGFVFGYIGQKYGFNIFVNSKILGNIAVIPGSFIVFILLTWRKHKRRKLEIIEAI
jgi:hypothetical protein